MLAAELGLRVVEPLHYVGKVFTAQLFGRALAHDPAYCINDIRFTAAIGSTAQRLPGSNGRCIYERLKPANLICFSLIDSLNNAVVKEGWTKLTAKSPLEIHLFLPAEV